MILFQATREDHGRWMCLINDNETFSANKHYVALHVGVEANLGININGGDVIYRKRLMIKNFNL